MPTGSEKEIENPKCMKAPCPMTGGYYIGGGLHICWLHILTVPGLAEVAHDQEFVALEKTA